MSYNKEEKTLLERRRKTGIIVSISTLATGIAILAVSMFFVSDSTLNLIKAIDSLSLFLLLSVSLYFLLEFVIPSSRRISFLNTIEKGGRKSVTGKVVSVSDPLTVYHNVKAYHVEIAMDKGKREIVKVDLDHPELLPEIGKEYSFTTSSGYVVEVSHHE